MFVYLDCFIYDHYMGKNCVRKCEDTDRQNGTSWVPDKTNIPGMEPQWGNSAHRHSACVHFWDPLLCGGWHSVAEWNASQPGTWYWRVIAGEIGAVAGGRASICASRFWVHA